MKRTTVWKISSLPTLLSLFLWLSGTFTTSAPEMDSRGPVSGTASPGWSQGPTEERGPFLLGVGIFCSLGIYSALRFQESLQAHARTR
jgi:hypothetical protein